MELSPLTVSELYRAAAGETSWRQALEAFDREMKALGTAVISATRRGALPSFSAALEEPTAAYLREGWHLLDERYRALPILRRGGVATDLDIFSAREIARSPFYQEFVARRGLKWWAAVTVKAGDQEYVVSVQRSPRQGRFIGDEKRKLLSFKAHFANALTLEQAMVEARAQGMLDVLESLHCAGFAIAEDGRVARFNTEAEQLMGRGLSIVGGRLRATLAADCQAIDALLRGLGEPSLLARPSPAPVIVRRAAGKPLVLSAIRLGPSLKGSFAGTSAVVIASDPDRRRTPDKSELARLFGLSAAEAQVAIRLAAGYSVERCADELRLRRGTVRQLIKQVLIKSDTHRQGEFVAVANRVIAARPRDGEGDG